MPLVFISHSSLDRERVEREIILPLRTHGVETWSSTDSIKSASEWERQISTGLKKCDWFLIALTPRSVSSEWVSREVHWAFLKRKDRIIPVMLETCEPDDLHLGLLPLQFIDFRNEVAAAQDQLLAIWGLDQATQVETRYHAAQQALAQEDWRAAIQHLESLLRLDPAHSQAAAELNHARQYEGLADLYDAGLTYLREKRWHEALANLREVQGIDGHYKDVADSIALANAELQKEDAERLYREALGAADREEWVAAVEQFEAVLKLNPSHAEAQAALSRAGQHREMIELYTVGREHLQQERWREALKSFRRLRAIDKSYRGVADLIAEADAGLEQEEVQRSERERQEREEAERQQQLAALFDGGLEHLKNGRWAEALSAFRQVQQAGGNYKDVSAQIEQAKGLQERQKREWKEQERREQQAREEAERKRGARVKTAMKLTPAAGNTRRTDARMVGLLVVLLFIVATFYARALIKEGIPFLASETQPPAGASSVNAVPPEELFVTFEKARREIDRDPRSWLANNVGKHLVAMGVLHPLDSPDAEFLYLYGRANLLTTNTDEAAKAFDAAIVKSDANPTAANWTIKREAVLGLSTISMRTQRDRWKALNYYEQITNPSANTNAP